VSNNNEKGAYRGTQVYNMRLAGVKADGSMKPGQRQQQQHQKTSVQSGPDAGATANAVVGKLHQSEQID
jgi:hypothetical protein